MIGLLPISRIITGISVLYAFLCAALFCILYFIPFSNLSIWSATSFALGGSTILQMLLSAWIYFGWRKIWSRFPMLGNIVYPDIAGVWDMEIYWTGPGQNDHGIARAKATIRQDFLRLSMDVKADNSDSYTLMASPRKDSESGQPILYYVYSVSTKAQNGSPSETYQGSAILRIEPSAEGKISGNYWTSNHRSGHFRLYDKNTDSQVTLTAKAKQLESE